MIRVAFIIGDYPPEERRLREEVAKSFSTAEVEVGILSVKPSPFGGLSPAEIDRTVKIIGAVRALGLAVVCIEHVMRALTTIADRVIVMHHGAVFFHGTPAQMLADPKVVEVYLGARHRAGET